MKIQTVVIATILLNLPVLSSSQQIWYCASRHDIGKIGLVRANWPAFGGSNNFAFPYIDCRTGSDVPTGSCLYQKNPWVTYLDYGIAWVGGVVRGDTLVSSLAFWPYYLVNITGDPSEFHPHEYPYRQMEHRSTLNPSAPEFKGAISEQDFISISTDTIPEGIKIIPDYFKFRPHIPMGLEFENRSFAWSLGYAEDFVIFEWLVRNIGDNFIDMLMLALK